LFKVGYHLGASIFLKYSVYKYTAFHFIIKLWLCPLMIWPDDVFVPNWRAEKDTAMYVTVVNTLQTQLVSRAATRAGYALMFRFNEKITEYGEGSIWL
jgi:hypothetical protein